MAILALKAMEHGDIPVHPELPKASGPSAPVATDAAMDPADAQASGASNTQSPDDSTTQAKVPGRPPSRVELVKAAMEEAATEIPQYLKRIARQSEKWDFKTPATVPQAIKTDHNIVMAWLKSMVKDPFFVRPGKDEPDFPEIDDDEDDAPARPLTEAEQKEEQQMLQELLHGGDDGKGDDADPNDPKEEGIQRYLLSHPDYLSYIMENEVWQCYEMTGTGERNVKFIPRYPRFDVRYSHSQKADLSD